MSRLRQHIPFPHAHHHVTQPQRVIQPLKLLVLPVPLHQPLGHLAVLPFIILHHLEEIFQIDRYLFITQSDKHISTLKQTTKYLIVLEIFTFFSDAISPFMAVSSSSLHWFCWVNTFSICFSCASALVRLYS